MGSDAPHSTELIERRERRKRGAKLIQMYWYGSLVAMLAIGALFSYLVLSGKINTVDSEVPILVLAYGAIAIFIGLYSRARSSELQEEIKDLDSEIELEGYDISERQIRAERLFRRNERQLMKYYNLNLRQNRMVMIIGISCIAASILVVSFTLWSVMGGFDHIIRGGASPPSVSGGVPATTHDIWLKGIAGVVGAVATIMVNVVGAIYLQMHGRAADALGQFHERLVATHQLFMANAFASRIEKAATRETLLSDLARGIVGEKP